MELINAGSRWCFGVLSRLLAGQSVQCSLLLISVLAGTFAYVIFQKLSRSTARDRALRRLWASLLAIRLFADDPRVVAQSFASVMSANGILLASAVPPLLVLIPLFLLSYGPLDSFFGTSPLTVEAQRVLTVRLNKLDDGWPNISLVTPPWIAVDSPPVHVFNDKEISWSIRATRAWRGSLRVIAGREAVEKAIDSRPGPRFFSLARTQSWDSALRYPGEEPLPAGLVSKVSISEPAAMISYFGFQLQWTWWFSILSALSALLAKLIASGRSVLYR